jgi:hypothetical protein
VSPVILHTGVLCTCFVVILLFLMKSVLCTFWKKKNLDFRLPLFMLSEKSILTSIHYVCLRGGTV